MYVPEPLLKLSVALLYSATIALIATLVVASFNPGCTNVDTMDMWGQAHARVYHDWHPITLTLLMTLLIKIYDGFQPVIVLQVLLFSSGIILALRKSVSPIVTIWLLLLVSIVPMVFYYLGFVSVDSFMACALIFSIGAFSRYTEDDNRAFFWLGLVGLYLGYAVRHNGIFAVIPLLLWPLLRFPRRRAVLAFVVIIVSFAGFDRLTSAVVHARHEYPQQGGLLYDLAALSVNRNVMLIPMEFQKPGITISAIQKVLDPYNDGWLFFGPNSVFRFTNDPVEMKILYYAWFRTVPKYTGEYLGWRFKVFEKYMGLAPTELEPYISSCIVPNDLGFRVVESPIHIWVMARLQPLGQSFLFRPYVYLLIALLFVVQGIQKRRWDTVLIAVSALTYSLGYFPFGQSANFRLAVYSAFAALLLFVRFCAEFVGEKFAVRAPMGGPNTVVRHTLIVLAIVVAIAGIIHLARPLDAVAAGEAVFKNADFETGDLAPWNTFQQVHAAISLDHPHGGRYSVAETDGAGSIWQDVSGLQPGGRYLITAWVSSSPSATATARIAVYDAPANVASVSSSVNPESAWKEVTFPVTASALGTLRIHLFREQGTGTVYWDDVHIEGYK